MACSNGSSDLFFRTSKKFKSILNSIKTEQTKPFNQKLKKVKIEQKNSTFDPKN